MSPVAKPKRGRFPTRVRERRAEPAWVSREVIEAVHSALLREHGGSAGIRDDGLLDSALNRPRNKWAYGEDDIAVLAAAYAFGIAKNHAFVDGNKRSAFTTAALFLAVNEFDLDAPEPEVVDIMTRVADSRLSEAALATWLRAHMVPR
jgi:death-on-curing protein